MNTDDLPLSFYTLSTVLVTMVGPAIYYIIEMAGFDPMWTVSLATKWCAKEEWVYLDTTLFYALTRDAGVLLGEFAFM